MCLGYLTSMQELRQVWLKIFRYYFNDMAVSTFFNIGVCFISVFVCVDVRTCSKYFHEKNLYLYDLDLVLEVLVSGNYTC